MSIDESRGGGVRLLWRGRFNIDDRVRKRGVQPIRQYGFVAVLSLHEPNDALAKIVLDVRQMQDVLAENPYGARSDITARDQEFNVVQGYAGEGEGGYLCD